MTRNTRPTAVALLLIASLAVGGVGAATDGGEATDGYRIAPAQDGEVSLASTEHSVTVGDTVEIGVEFAGGADAATLLVGDDESQGYQANVSLTDGNDDGVVAIQFDTAAAGSADEAVVDAVADGDTAELTGQTAIDDPLASGSYDLVVATTDDPANAEEAPDDRGQLMLAELTPEPSGEVSFSSDRIRLEAESGEVVAGTADLPEGAEIELRARTTNASVRFFKTAAVTVTPDGTFVAKFNMNAQSPGDEFVVHVLYDDEEVAEAEGRIVDDATATATETAASTPTRTATPESTEASVPGFGATTALLAVLAAIGAVRRR